MWKKSAVKAGSRGSVAGRKPESTVKVEWIRFLLQFIEVGIRGWGLKQAAIKQVSLCKALVTVVKDEYTSLCSGEPWNNGPIGRWCSLYWGAGPKNQQALLTLRPLWRIFFFNLYCLFFYCSLLTFTLFYFDHFFCLKSTDCCQLGCKIKA